ncbi:MAG TPA: hypothetical protein VFA76_16240 [Terriglobales bacterium]|nr:hypothetical protein [Terriglobales bacterium]
MKLSAALLIFAVILAETPAALPQSRRATASPKSSNVQRAVHPRRSRKIVAEDELRIQGEQRFGTNCGRCHMPPHKFPPRMMATIVRHMRVRATLTEDDMHLILRYMTQ